MKASKFKSNVLVTLIKHVEQAAVGVAFAGSEIPVDRDSRKAELDKAKEKLVSYVLKHVIDPVEEITSFIEKQSLMALITKLTDDGYKVSYRVKRVCQIPIYEVRASTDNGFAIWVESTSLHNLTELLIEKVREHWAKAKIQAEKGTVMTGGFIPCSVCGSQSLRCGCD